MPSIQVSGRQNQIAFGITENNNLPIALTYYPSSKAIIDETNARVEKWSGILFFVMVKMTLLFGALPWFICTYFIYFTTDLGVDAFVLPFPLW